jgi:uncharacterized OB-fold protein
MTTTTPTTGGGADEVHPGASLIGTTASDRCSSCGAELAPDQRYCIECGTRRGKPRFTLQTVPQRPTVEETTTTTAVLPTARPAWSASTALLATVAVILIALGVGVWIGHNGASQRSAGTKVTVVGAGGGAASAASGATGSTGSAAGSTATGTRHGRRKASATQKASLKKAPPKAVQKAAVKAAKQTLGAAGTVSIAAPTTTVGGKCSANTAGCSNGHFTGSFF